MINYVVDGLDGARLTVDTVSTVARIHVRAAVGTTDTFVLAQQDEVAISQQLAAAGQVDPEGAVLDAIVDEGRLLSVVRRLLEDNATGFSLVDDADDPGAESTEALVERLRERLDDTRMSEAQEREMLRRLTKGGPFTVTKRRTRG